MKVEEVTHRELITELVRLSGMSATDIIHLLDRLKFLGLCIMPDEHLPPSVSKAVFERLNNPTQADEESAKAAAWDFIVAYPAAVSAFQKQLEGK